MDHAEQHAAKDEEPDEQDWNQRRQQVRHVAAANVVERLTEPAPLLAGELDDGHAGEDPAKESPDDEQPQDQDEEVDVDPERGPRIKEVVDRGEELEQRLDQIGDLVGAELVEYLAPLQGGSAHDRFGHQERVGAAVFRPRHRPVLAAVPESQPRVSGRYFGMEFLIMVGEFWVPLIGWAGKLMHQLPGRARLVVLALGPGRALFLGREAGFLLRLSLKVAFLGDRPSVVEDERDEPPAEGRHEDPGGGDQELERVKCDQEGAEQLGPRRRLGPPAGVIAPWPTLLGHAVSPWRIQSCYRRARRAPGDGWEL